VKRARVGAAIFLAWAGALGWLVKREYFRTTSERLAEAALSVPPGAVYFRLDLGGQQVGFASTTVDTLPTTIRVRDQLILDVPAAGVLHRTKARSDALLSRALRLQSVSSAFEGDVGRFSARGEVSGDTALTLTLVTAGDTQTTRAYLTRPIVVPTVVPLRLAFGGALKPGSRQTIRTFDPLLLVERDVAVTIAAESTLVVPDSAGYDSTALAWVPVHFDTVRAFRILEEAGGLETSAWIDGQGRVVRATTPAGFTLERTAFELAYENFRHRDTARVARASAATRAGDVVPATALAAGAALRPTALAQLRVRITRADVRGRDLDLAGGRQRRAGDTLIVTRETPAALAATYVLPARDSALRPFLAVEPLVQSTDPRIRAQARRILGGARDPAQAAQLLLHWVARNVAARRSGDLPSAVQVLERRRGDCNEHTVLYVALARAAGLPARAAAGLLYLDGRFYYHAWPEVWLGGGWVAVDPTLDQFPADAGHVRFTADGLARQVELVRIVGRLRLEVL